MTKIDRFFIKLSYLTLILGFILIGLTIKELFEKKVPIEFYNERFPVITKQVKRGEYFQYRLTGRKNVNLTATLYRQLICANQDGNKKQYNLDPSFSTTPPGEFDHIINIYIPPFIEPGVCIFRETGTFHYSFLRDVVLTVESEDFEVL